MIDNPSFESSAHGRIEQVLFSIPSWVVRYQNQVEIRGTSALYRSVFETLKRHVRFVVVTQQEGEPHLREWLTELGVQDRTDVVTIPNRTKLSVWAEDKFTVCSDESGNRWLLHPFSEDRCGDATATKAIAELVGWEYVEVEEPLQSGNILVGDDFMLVGADSAAAMSGLGIRDASRTLHVIGSRIPVPGFKPSYDSRDISVEGAKWCELCYRGNSANTVQPVFHIDAFITLAGRGASGRNRLLVGDPAMAAQVLGSNLPDHAMQAVFDDIAVQLDAAGFDVIRNPLPLVFQDNHISKARQWYFASANNALVEIDGPLKTVWLPTYGYGCWDVLEATDRTNEEIWRELGFSVRTLGDFHPFAVNLGALRCMTKCLIRGK